MSITPMIGMKESDYLKLSVDERLEILSQRIRSFGNDMAHAVALEFIGTFLSAQPHLLGRLGDSLAGPVARSAGLEDRIRGYTMLLQLPDTPLMVEFVFIDRGQRYFLNKEQHDQLLFERTLNHPVTGEVVKDASSKTIMNYSIRPQWALTILQRQARTTLSRKDARCVVILRDAAEVQDWVERLGVTGVTAGPDAGNIGPWDQSRAVRQLYHALTPDNPVVVSLDALPEDLVAPRDTMFLLGPGMERHDGAYTLGNRIIRSTCLNVVERPIIHICATEGHLTELIASKRVPETVFVARRLGDLTDALRALALDRQLVVMDGPGASICAADGLADMRADREIHGAMSEEMANFIEHGVLPRDLFSGEARPATRQSPEPDAYA